MTSSDHHLSSQSFTMEKSDIVAYALAALAILLLRIWDLANRTKRNPKSLPLHPGPKPLPIVGNILDVPGGEYPWIRIAEWRKFYGTICLSSPIYTS